MKYRIPEHILLQTIDNEQIKDVIFHELTEAEFLVEYLKNPSLNYWKIYSETHREMYSDGHLMVTIQDSIITNHAVSKSFKL